MPKANQFVYRYNGDPSSEETESDLLGVVPVPVKGDVLNRRGKTWTVVKVDTTQTISSSDPLSHSVSVPVHHVFLSDQL